MAARENAYIAVRNFVGAFRRIRAPRADIDAYQRLANLRWPRERLDGTDEAKKRAAIPDESLALPDLPIQLFAEHAMGFALRFHAAGLR